MMEEISEIICVTCPKGCTLRVKHDGKKVLDVENGCKRGHEYAICELSDPRRMVASTVRVKDGLHPPRARLYPQGLPQAPDPPSWPVNYARWKSPHRLRSTRWCWQMPSTLGLISSHPGICRNYSIDQLFNIVAALHATPLCFYMNVFRLIYGAPGP